MSEEQLSALLAKLKDDAALREKFQSAADLDAFLALANEAGLEVSKADWLKYQEKNTLDAFLSDAQLESVAGGQNSVCGSTGEGAKGNCNDSNQYRCCSN